MIEHMGMSFALGDTFKACYRFAGKTPLERVTLRLDRSARSRF
ncbi:hypothetical protein MP213Fo_28720 [Pseudochrobactrum sp. MP213Fo]